MASEGAHWYRKAHEQAKVVPDGGVPRGLPSGNHCQHRQQLCDRTRGLRVTLELGATQLLKPVLALPSPGDRFPRNVPEMSREVHSLDMPARKKLSEAQLKRIRRRLRAGGRLSALAEQAGVNRRTVRRRLDALALAEAERARSKAARQANRTKGVPVPGSTVSPSLCSRAREGSFLEAHSRCSSTRRSPETQSLWPKARSERRFLRG